MGYFLFYICSFSSCPQCFATRGGRGWNREIIFR